MSLSTKSDSRAAKGEMRPELALALGALLDIHEALQHRREALRRAVESSDPAQVEDAARALLGMPR
jgi:hypothetical protein